MNTIDSVKHVLLLSGRWLGLMAARRAPHLQPRPRDRALALSAATRRRSRYTGAHRSTSTSRAATLRPPGGCLRRVPPSPPASRTPACALPIAASTRRTRRCRARPRSSGGRLERPLAYLATVGNNAPFVGLFGTVVGVIHAFEELGHAAPGYRAPAAAQVASCRLSWPASLRRCGGRPSVSSSRSRRWPRTTISNAGLLLLLSRADVLTNLVLAYIADDAGRPSAPPKLREVAHGGV